MNLFSPKKFALLLALFLGVAFFPVLFLGQTFYYRDFGVLAIPTATYHRDSIWHGEIPLWNPYSNCGAPFLAQWGTMVCYPLSLIYVLLPMPWSLNFFCIAHLWLGGMGMYFLARRWTREGWPAALAGIIFVFNGITLASLTWPNYVAALGLFPWLALSVGRAWEPKIAPLFPTRFAGSKSAPIVFAAILSAMQILTGVPELCFLTWLFLSVLWLWRLVKSGERATSLIGRQIAIVLLTAGLVAIQMLPFLQLLQHSQRTPGFAGEKWALPPWGWANFLLPRFHTFRTYEGTVFQMGQEFLSSTYIGAPILILSLLGFSRKDPRTRIAGTFGLLAAILALGSAGTLLPAINRIFPFLSIARYPVKFLFLLPLMLPLLAANGILLLEGLEQRKRQKVVLGAALVFTLIIAGLLWFEYSFPVPFAKNDPRFPIVWPEIQTNSLIRWMVLVLFGVTLPIAFARSQRFQCGAVIGLMLLLAIDSLTHLPRQNPTIDASFFAAGFWEGAQKKSNPQFQKPDVGNGRVFITPAAEEHLLRSVVPDPQKDLIGKRLALWSHLNLLDRVPKVNGSSTLQVREQALVQGSLYSGTNLNLSAWLDFLDATLQTASNSVVEWQPRSTALPFLTGGQAIFLTGENGTPAPNLPANFDFRKQVLVQSISPEFQIDQRGAKAEFSQINFSPQEILFTANADAPTVAVIPQSWYPAWRVDYKRAVPSSPLHGVLRANVAFQAVPLPKGESIVRIYYHDTFFLLGAGISAFFLLVCSFILIGFRRSQLSMPEPVAIES